MKKKSVFLKVVIFLIKTFLSQVLFVFISKIYICIHTYIEYIKTDFFIFNFKLFSLAQYYPLKRYLLLQQEKDCNNNLYVKQFNLILNNLYIVLYIKTKTSEKSNCF